MADTIKVSELTPAAQLNNTDLFIISQGSAGNYASLNTTLLALASKIVANTNYTSDLHTNSKTIVGALNEIFNSGNLADTYDTTETYEEDDYCIYQGLLYKCIAQTTGEFDTNDWVQTTITDELVQGGGGGTNVVANPVGTPTDNLDTIQIGNVIYDIPGSGGSGGTGGLTKTALYENASGTLESVISLSQSIEDFDFVEIVTQYPHTDDNDYRQNAIYNTEELIDSIGTARPINWHIGNDSIYTWIYITDVDEFTVHTNTQASLGIRYVYGYKVASGGGSASWKDVTGILTAGQTEITLSDASITENSTFEPFADKFGVKPTDMEFVAGAETVLQPLVTQESELLGTVTVASTFSSYSGWKAFTSEGSWVGTGSIDQWLAYEFPTDVTISAIQWHCDDTSRRGIVTSIQYSDDGTTWNDCTLSTNERGNVEISSVNSAKHWRLFFAAPFATWTEPMISNLEFIAITNGVKLTFPVQSENLNVKVRVS